MTHSRPFSLSNASRRATGKFLDDFVALEIPLAVNAAAIHEALCSQRLLSLADDRPNLVRNPRPATHGSTFPFLSRLCHAVKIAALKRGVTAETALDTLGLHRRSLRTMLKWMEDG